LAKCLEIASGKNYAELLQEYVFNPAGMKDSLDFNGEMIMERRAQDYLLDERVYFNAPLKDYSFLVGAGSVFSTAHDIHKFGEAFHNGTYGEISKQNFVREGVFQSNGSTNGHRSYVKINTSKKYGYVLLANLSTGASDMILQALEKILEGKDVAAPIIPKPNFLPSLISTTEFLGRYQSSNNRSFELTVKNNVLYAGDRKLMPIKTDCFFDFKSYGEVCFKRDGNRRITEMTWTSDGATSNWVRQ
ncbi:MAG: beta-lactamase family protein, partial [Blastocatellia bacterium]|nr:beta-lactamase family protein [Blastocatellia bacterium]